MISFCCDKTYQTVPTLGLSHSASLTQFVILVPIFSIFKTVNMHQSEFKKTFVKIIGNNYRCFGL